MAERRGGSGWGGRGSAPLPALPRALLLVLDLQALFVGPGAPAPVAGWPEAAARLDALVQAFGARGLPAIRTRHVHPPDDTGGAMGFFFPRLLRRDDPWAAWQEGACPAADALPLVDKARFSALSVPRVAAAARREGVVVIAGVQTPRCVLATALDVARLGLRAIVAADACAAPEGLHEPALAVLAEGHAHVASVAAIVAALAAGEGA